MTKVYKLIVGIILFAGLSLSSYAENISQTFMVPLPEQDVYDAFDAIEYDQSIGTNMRSIISMVVGESSTVIYYDNWEDGYEDSIFSPTQSTSYVWGDGNTNNGYLPAYPTDVFSAGDNISLDNYIPMPRDNGVYYDGRDKISVTRPIALTRAMYPDATGPLMAGAVQALDTTQHGLVYRSAIGEDISYNNTFDYVGMFVMASEDPTLVRIDTNGDSIVDIEQWLESGERIFIDSGISVGATASSEKPIQAHLVAGKYDGNYKVRLFTLFPSYQWTDRYYTPVGSTTDAGGEVVMFLHNPNSVAITVNYETATSSGTVNVAAKSTGSVVMPVGEAGYFYTSDGSVFLALSTISGGAAGQAFDWGFSPVPQKSLSTMVICAWGWGSSDLSGNYSPFWVTAVSNTTIYIDYDSDPTTGALTDSAGNHYDVAQTANRLQSYTIYNSTTNDQTRMRVYTLDGTYLNGAWGEYPADPPTPPGGTSLDMGTALMPFPAILVKKNHEIWTDVDGNGKINPGDSLKYILTINNHGFQTATNIIVHDILPDNVTYETGTFVVNGVTNADDTVPPASTEFPLDENGYNLGSLDVGATSTVSYVLVIDSAYPIEEGVLINSVYIESSEGQRQGIDPVRVVPPDLSIAKTSSAAGPVKNGDTITYTVTVSNDSGYAHSSVQINDTLPATLAYVASSTKYVVVTNLIHQTVKDNFSVVSYGNNDGSTNWLGDWTEIGESNGPVTNFVAVDNSLGISASSRGAWRMVDLSGYSNATLKLAYRRDFLVNNSAKTAAIEVSSNGGDSWTTLEALTGDTNDPVAGVDISYDISSYMATNTAIRFITGGAGWSNGFDWVYFDGVLVEFTRPGSGSGTTNNGSAPPQLVLLSSLPAYSDLIVTFDAVVENIGAASQVVNQAYVVSDISQDPLYASVTDLVARADIAVYKSANETGPFSVGDAVSFTVIATNNGPDDASGVELTDLWPSNSIIFNSATPSQGSYVTSSNIWNVGDLSTGVSASLVISGTVVAVDSVALGITNNIEVTASDLYDPIMSNNTDDAVIITAADPGSAIVGDYVWYDVNVNGLQDAGESGSTGIVVRIYKDLDFDGVAEPGGDDGSPIAVTNTYSAGGINGLYDFTSLTGGYYFVEFVVPSGHVFTTANVGGDDSVDSDADANGLSSVFLLAGGETNNNIDAGLVVDTSGGDCGQTYLVADGGDLFTKYDRISNTETLIGALGVPDVEAIAFDPGSKILYAADAGDLGTINLASGAYTLIGAFGSGDGALGNITFGDVDGLTFNPLTSEFYGSVRRGGTTDEDLLIMIDPVTGAAIPDAFGAGIDYVVINVISNLYDIDDIAIDAYDGQMYGIANQAGLNDRLVKIDKITGTATDVGVLGVNDHEGLSFDNGGQLYGTTGNAGGNDLYDVDKATGAASNMRPLTEGTDYEGSESLTCPPNEILGTIYYDVNADGIFDPGEAGQTGVIVRLYRDVNSNGVVDASDVLLSTNVTDANGEYDFSVAASGLFVLDIDSNSLPDSTILTTDNLETADFGSSVGQTDYNNDFGFVYMPSIGDFVWEDLNGNGLQDVGEPGISNVIVRLYDDQTNLVATTITDTNGIYAFNNLFATNYYIEVVEPPGYSLTEKDVGSDNTIDSDIDQLTGFSSLITLIAGEQNKDIDAGLYQGISIGDYVWFDTNEDGIQNIGEPGSNGVQVLLYIDADGDGIQEPDGDDGPAVGTNVTYNNGGNDGYYDFTGYPPGNYYLKFVLPYGDAFTLQNVGGDSTIDSDPNSASGLTDIFTLISGGSTSDWDAGLVTADLGLTITKVSDTGGVPQNAGDTITYTITVENTGTVTLAGVNITDVLPTGVTYVPNSTKVVHYEVVTNTVRDEFNAVSYANQDGTVNWANDWQEIGETNGPAVNAVAVANKWGTDYQVKVVRNARGLWREADFSGYDTATLTFDYKVVSFDDAGEFSTIMVSSNGMLDTVTLQSWTTNVLTITAVSYDISSYISANTTILFTNSLNNAAGEGIQLDDIQIEFVKSGFVTNDGGTPPNLASGYTLATGKTITVIFEVTVDTPIIVTQLVNSASVAAIGVAPVDDTVTDDVASSIGNRVWNDINGDGIQDAGEPGIENVTMELYTNGVLVTSIITDSNGEYLFTNLLAGTYTVVVDTNTMPSGLADNPTYDRDGTLDHQTTLTIVQGEHVLDADFGYDEYPTLVVVSGFSATTIAGEVLVSWDIEIEVGTIGYYLERQTDSGWIRINDQLISRVPFGNAEPPYSYSVVDPGVVSGGTYSWRIVELDNQGRLLNYGPYAVTVDGIDISYESWAVGIDWNGKDSSLGGDADGDGFSNFEEYLAGTDPLDANSLLQITGIGMSDTGDIVVRWQSASGAVYSVEISTDINGAWLPVTNGVIATPPININTININVGASDRSPVQQMFFRVIGE